MKDQINLLDVRLDADCQSILCMPIQWSGNHGIIGNGKDIMGTGKIFEVMKILGVDKLLVSWRETISATMFQQLKIHHGACMDVESMVSGDISQTFSQAMLQLLGVFANINLCLQQWSKIMSHNQDIFHIGLLFERDTLALSTSQHNIRHLHHGIMYSSTQQICQI